ncbi:MAG: hypothetical protein H0X64_12730, partial [Gemmatimonadaceae bacterium]|nr:hypothetical protein [Gemmatimonadaceae bacterium]
MIGTGLVIGGVLVAWRHCVARSGLEIVPATVARVVVLAGALTPLVAVSAVALTEVTRSRATARILDETGRMGDVLLVTGTALGTGYDRMAGLIAIGALLWVTIALGGVARLIVAARIHRAVTTLHHTSVPG